MKQKKKSFNDEGDIIIPNLDILIKPLLDDADDDTEKFIKKHGIPKFLVSRHWISKFMQRNDLTFKKPHSEKRTVVIDDEVDMF